eukprot:tig00001154_g7292.t1
MAFVPVHVGLPVSAVRRPPCVHAPSGLAVQRVRCGQEKDDDLLKDPMQRRLEKRFAELQVKYDFMARDPKSVQEKAKKQLEQLQNLPPSPSRYSVDGNDDAIDVDSREEGPSGPPCIEDGPGGIPYYVGYSQLELKKLYDIHQSLEGELSAMHAEAGLAPQQLAPGAPDFGFLDGIQAAVQKHLAEARETEAAEGRGADADEDTRGGGFPM